MLWTHQNKVLEDIKQSTNTLMTASWHVVAKLLTVSRMSKVDYQNKVLPSSTAQDMAFNFRLQKTKTKLKNVLPEH